MEEQSTEKKNKKIKVKEKGKKMKRRDYIYIFNAIKFDNDHLRLPQMPLTS